MREDVASGEQQGQSLLLESGYTHEHMSLWHLHSSQAGCVCTHADMQEHLHEDSHMGMHVFVGFLLTSAASSALY